MPRFTERQPVTIHELNSLRELGDVAPEWWELWRKDASATPFQSPAWLLPWWRHVGQGELITLAIRSREAINGTPRLVGLMPLYIYEQPQTGSRDVFPLGISTSDYLDALFAPGWEHPAIEAAMKHLGGQSQRWDQLDLRQLRPTSSCATASLPTGWEGELKEDEPCPQLALPSSIVEFRALASQHLIHNLHYYRKRAAKCGQVRVERASHENLTRIYQALLDLHRARWLTRGEDGCLIDPAVQEAHRESLPQLLDEQMLRLYAISIDHRIIGVLYGMVDPPTRRQRSFYYYLGGFDPEFEHISPGTLLIGHAIEEAIADGIAVFDFLRGRESYKYLWGARDAKTLRRRLCHNAARIAPENADAQLELSLKGRVRPCELRDLPTLEWFGLFAEQGDLIRQQFVRHQRGEAVMLVAEINGVPSGQAWVELARNAERRIGYIWALRVFPTLQRQHIGTQLIATAEAILRQRDFDAAELSVQKQNVRARRLYERLGYQVVDELRAGSTKSPLGLPTCESGEQWVMRKSLRPASAREREHHPGQEDFHGKREEDRVALDARGRERPRV